MWFRFQGGPRLAWATLLCLTASALAPRAFAQPQNEADTSLEEFEKVDPYTKGEPEAMKRAGYVSFGPFHWADAQTTETVRSTLGDIPMVFIETEHFRLASSLKSYRLIGDKIERDRLDDEFAELRKKLPKAKVSPKIDNWLRAHLYAYRLEKLYAQFCEAFGVTPADFEKREEKAKAGQFVGSGPYLGQKDKFTVLLTEKRSALGRYLREYVKQESEYSYRFQFGDCFFFGANFEALKDGGRELDIALHTAVAGAMTQNFLDAFRESNMAAPQWLRYGAAHWFARRIDERWNQWNAGGSSSPDEKDTWNWQPRVWGLVKNEATGTWDEMLGWQTPEQIQPRDHMLAWSRVDWILRKRKDSAHKLLFELTEKIAGSGEERAKASRAQQEHAFAEAFQQGPADLDREWRKWVLDTYEKN